MSQTIRQIIELQARDKTRQGIASATRRMSSFDRFIKRIHTTLLGFVGLNIATGIVRDFVYMSDEAVNLNNRLKLVTNGVAETNRVMDSLVETSLKTGTALSANAVLYTRMARPIKALGFSIAETLGVTELFAKGLRISGASAQETTSTIRQASQAFSSGVLRGEEFNAILENGGRLAIALADGMNVSIGELRAMSKQGELTAEVVTRAWLSQTDVLDAENAKMVLTISQSIENVKTKMTEFLTTHTQSNAFISNFFNGIATNFDTIVSVMVPALLLALSRVNAAIVARAKLRIAEHLNEKATAAKKLELIRLEIESEKQKGAIQADSARVRAVSDKAEAQRKVANLNLTNKQALAEQSIARVRHRELLLSRELARVAVTRSIGTERHTIAVAHLATVERKLLITEQALEITTKKATVSTTLLSDARTIASIASDRLSVATTRNTIAQNANNLSYASGVASVSLWQKKITVAGIKNALFTKRMAGGGAKIARAFKPLGALVGRLGSALLGVWGIAGYVLYEMTKNVVDYGLQWEITKTLVAKFFAFGHKERLDQLDKEYDDFTTKRAKDKLAQAQGFADAEEMETKAHQENVRAQINEDSKLRKSRSDRAEAFEEVAKIREQYLASELKAVKDSTTAKLANLELVTDTTKTSLEAQLAHGETHSVALFDLEQKSTIERFSILKSGLVERRDAIFTNLDELYSKTKKGSADRTKVTLQAMEASREVIVAEIEFHKNAVSAMSAHYNELTRAIASHASKAKGILQSSEDFINGIRRKNFTELETQLDNERKYRDALAKSREADSLDEVKDFGKIKELREEAKTLFEEYINLSQSSKEKSKKGSLEEQKAQSDVNAALHEYKTNNESLAGAYDKNKESLIKLQAIEKKGIDEHKKGIADQLTQLTELDTKLKVQRQVVVDLDISKAVSSLKKLDKSINATLERVAKLKIADEAYRNSRSTRTENHSEGGQVGLVDTSTYMPRRHGKITGSTAGDNDTVPTMLQRGEFVVRQYAVSTLGTDFLRKLNNTPKAMSSLAQKPVQQLSFGGVVGAIPSLFNKNGEANQRSSVNLGTISEAPYGTNGDPRVDRAVTEYRESINRFRDDFAAGGGSTTSYVLLKHVAKEYGNMAEQVRTLPSKYTRGGLSILEQLWEVNKGQGLDSRNSSVATKLYSDFKSFMSESKRSVTFDKKYNRYEEYDASSASNDVSNIASGSFGSKKTKNRDNPITKEATPLTRPLNKPNSLSYLAGKIAPLRNKADSSVQQITSQSTSNTASNGATKTVSIDLSIDGKTATGVFPDNDATDNVIDKLKFLNRAQIK